MKHCRAEVIKGLSFTDCMKVFMLSGSWTLGGCSGVATRLQQSEMQFLLNLSRFLRIFRNSWGVPGYTWGGPRVLEMVTWITDGHSHVLKRVYKSPWRYSRNLFDSWMNYGLQSRHPWGCSGSPWCVEVSVLMLQDIPGGPWWIQESWNGFKVKKRGIVQSSRCFIKSLVGSRGPGRRP